MNAPYTRDHNADCVAEIVLYGASYRIVRNDPSALLIAVKAAKSFSNATALLFAVVVTACLTVILTHVGDRDLFSFTVMLVCALYLRQLIRGIATNVLLAWKWRRFAQNLQLYLFINESAQRKAQQ